MKASPLLIPILLLLAAGGPAHGAPSLPHPLPGEEAPPALFDFQLGSSEVDFYLKGSWKATLAGALGFLVTPAGELVFPSAFPGLEGGQLFQQVPDLAFSVWLQEKYFLEGSLIGDFLQKQYEYLDQNYLLMGYRGPEGRFLRSVLFGTRDIAIDPFPFLEAPESGSSSLGASLRLGAGRSDHQLLLRYDNNEAHSVTFLGRNLVEESTLELAEHVRGRFFRLPDAGVDALELFLEDPDGAYADGSGRRYRRATVEDAVLDSAGGTVSLKKAAAGAVLVYYTKLGSPVGSAGLGTAALPAGTPGPAPYYLDLSLPYLRFQWDDELNLADYLGHDMDERKVTVGGKLCLRLYRPGEFSPFELLGAYPLAEPVPPDLSRLRVQVFRKGEPSEAVSSDVRFRLAPGQDYFTAYRTEDLRGNLRNLVPFLDGDLASPLFDPDNLLYGPAAEPSPGYLQYELRVGRLTPVDEYRLGEDVVPGSVQVLRNGVSETRFEADYERGVVRFLTEIAPDDRLVVSFRRRVSLAGNGDFLFTWGNTVALGPGHSLKAAAGVRWNALPGGYSEEAYSRTGSAAASLGLEGTAGPLRYKASAAAAFTNPDTTGLMRLLGMEGQGREVVLSEDTAYPAARPQNTAVLPGELQEADRGRLLYKDFRSYGLAGTSALMPYTWTPPAEQVFPYETGSKPGPYKAAGGSQGATRGESLVLEYELAAGEWVGAQLPLNPGQGLADLSGLRSLTVSYRALDLGGSAQLYVQLGETAEDLDDDGALDREGSASSAGFPFDTPLGILRVGSGPRNQGNSRLDSEDVDGNGRLDGEDTSIARPYLLALPSQALADDGWHVLRYAFSAAELDRLRRVRSLRLLVLESGGAAAAGRLLVDRVTLEGSRFQASDLGSGLAVTVREVEEWAGADPPAEELEEAFPEVADTFHPFGEEQKVLEIRWSDGPGDWEVRGYTQAESGGIDYRSVAYYYRLPAVSGGADLEFSLLDADGQGIRWSVPASGAVPDWSRIEVSLDERAVYRDGALLPTATVSEDAGHGSLTVFTAGLSAAAAATSDSGALYLDELALADPRSELGAAFQGELELELPGSLVSWGGHAVVHDLRLRQEASAGSRGFASLYGTPLEEGTLSARTELEVGLSVVDLEADLLAGAGGGESTLAGGHRLSVPNVDFPVRFSEEFSLNEGAAGRELYRRDRLTASARGAALEAEAAASSLEGLLTQSWSAGLQISPWLLSFDQALELTETREGYAVPERDYFSNWIGSYGLLVPWSGGQPVERLSRATLDWSLAGRPVGLRAAADLGTRSTEFAAGSRALASTLELELSLPVTYRRQELTLLSVTPGYRRSIEVADRLGAEGSLGLDLADGGSALAAQRCWFAGVPLAELFDAATEELFTEASPAAFKVVYTPQLFLSLSRFTSSRWFDLLLPSQAELALDKELKKEGDLRGFRNHFRLTLQSRALNLFGTLGAYPLFPFYRTDEASGSVQVTAGTAGEELEQLSVAVNHYLACDAERGRFALENRFAYTEDGGSTWEDTLGALWAWTRRPPGGVRLPLLRPETGAQAYWEHEESLQLGLAGGRPEEGADPLHPFNLVLGHSTALALPQFGYLKAVLQLGLDAEKVEGEGIYWRTGLKAGLEARLEF